MLHSPTPSQHQVDSTISSKGQVTIPAEIRRHLGVGQGDKLTFVVEGRGRVEVTAARYPTIASLRGAAGRLPTPLSWKEMQRIAHEDHRRESETADLG